MTLVLCAHGTRSEKGRAAVRSLVDACRHELGGEVVDAYVDVHGPSLEERLVPGATVVPLFLAAGYHVRVDIAGAARTVPGVRVAAPLGPSEVLVAMLHERLLDLGVDPRDRQAQVVLASAGSSDDSSALASTRTAAALAAELGRPVHVAYGASRAPSVPDRVAGLRAGGADRVVVASYLLAPGHFHRRLLDAGADAVTAPLLPGREVDRRLVSLVRRRCDEVRSLSA